MSLRLGSLCSGFGGLDLAIAQVLNVETVWHAENDLNAAKVLVHHWPDVPNHGDITAMDWTALEPVDALTAGFPCQPVSQAGQQMGVADERWLFDVIAEGISRMVVRPRMLFIENVRGLLSADGGDTMARVVHGLARLGYVGSWRTLRASDVGACHRRGRVFIVARQAAPHSSSAVGRGPQFSSLAAPPRRATESRERPRQRAWGPFELAIRQHERTFGRSAPKPTDDAGWIDPLFVEWMMGLPEGWVTDVDIPRSAQLRILGNGVVPAQGAAAYANLLGVQEVAA